jgi:hypothetical protein
MIRGWRDIYNVNDNLNISFMKRTFFVALSFVALFATSSVQAQFRSLPGVVTDSFKVKYPDAKDVSWADKVSAFQATFMLGSDRVVARYSKDGQWQGSTKAILKDAIPSAVKDGLAKSLYASAEWEIHQITVKYLPGQQTQYILLVQKSDIQKRNLTFNADGQLVKDVKTL